MTLISLLLTHDGQAIYNAGYRAIMTGEACNHARGTVARELWRQGHLSGLLAKHNRILRSLGMREVQMTARTNHYLDEAP